MGVFVRFRAPLRLTIVSIFSEQMCSIVSANTAILRSCGACYDNRCDFVDHNKNCVGALSLMTKKADSYFAGGRSKLVGFVSRGIKITGSVNQKQAAAVRTIPSA
jgi:hypothetical protein